MKQTARGSVESPRTFGSSGLRTGDWSLAVGDALLGGDGGGPRSGAVGGAQRSGPPCRSSIDRETAWGHGSGNYSRGRTSTRSSLPWRPKLLASRDVYKIKDVFLCISK